MEKYEVVEQDAATPTTAEAPDAREAPAPARPDEPSAAPASAPEAVTPYDHLWFERRPLV